MVSAARGRPDAQARHDGDDLIRRRIVCRGTVQGVGFRPAVYRLATALQLSGWVRNDPDGATIEVEGAMARVESFERRLPTALPPLASLAGIRTSPLPPTTEVGFRVDVSRGGPRERALIPPDAVLCDACRAELEDAQNRRHRYPFTTCTDCGPRFSIVLGLPYDRERTSMARFPMCPECAAEYADPRTRRFHAEPTCCPSCGPRLFMCASDGRVLADGADAIVDAQRTLAAGGIVAVKGLGGFQLACRADDEIAVLRLRLRKRRPTKPLAVMVRDVDTARHLVALGSDDERLLRSPHGPVVLAPRRQRAPIAAGVAPGTGDLGVFLPTTPLHVELFRDAPYGVLVMTSGNLSDEPICKANREAIERLGGIADRILAHDRDVVRRVDDSVVRATDDGPVVVRRSRGYVPAVLPLPVPVREPVLALGGHLQTTACLAVGDDAVTSQHVGDLDHDEARAFLLEVARGLEQFLECEARIVVVDQHPDYPSVWLGERLAAERGGRVLRVQHHLAHAAAVLAENGAFPQSPAARVGAIVLDGTGHGPDGTAWGGEWLVLDGALHWARVGCVEPLPLVGGERAVREPWRVAIAALNAEGALDVLARLPLARLIEADRLAAVARLASRGGFPLASGAGRLFEAAGAMLGMGKQNGYEGELAVRFEALAATEDAALRPWPEVRLPKRAARLPGTALLAALARRSAGGEDPAAAAAGFHATFARLAAQLAARVFPAGVTHVALGGGCLVNRLLRRTLSQELRAVGREPLLPRAVPPGDGGLAYGQAVLGSAAVTRGNEPRLRGGS